jgi:blue copper oxidase
MRGAAAGAGLLAAGGAGGVVQACSNPGDATGPGSITRLPLRIPPELQMDGAVLAARRGSAMVASGVTAPVWTIGESGATGPTLVTRRGQRVRVRLDNDLGEPTILHWHGFRPPEQADGHPRYAVGHGASFDYDFVVNEPPGLYWYHSHAHMRTGVQTYMGMAGLILVRDGDGDGLGLPSGARELPLLIADRRVDGAGVPVYSASGPAMMEGFLGNAVFVNGVREPVAEIDSALYRLRVLNASNARIFRVARSDGRPMLLIGTDAGFLAEPVEVPHVDMSTGERADLLVDFSDLAAGARVQLVSLPFPAPAAGGMMMGGMGQGTRQGAGMELMEFVVRRKVTEQARLPTSLPAATPLTRAGAERQRNFRFASMMMNHTINGRSFDMQRVDERVPFGATEVWSFINDGPFPHPVHMHAVHFHVLSRTGGRGQVFPWERGPKDTVLVHPGERVDVVARFDSHPGLFLLHCHNLEHEDMGMMMNFLVE